MYPLYTKVDGVFERWGSLTQTRRNFIFLRCFLLYAYCKVMGLFSQEGVHPTPGSYLGCGIELSLCGGIPNNVYQVELSIYV